MTDSPAQLEIVRTWVSYERIPAGVRLPCLTANGAEAEVRVTFPLPAVMRLQMRAGHVQERPSEMLVLPADKPASVGLQDWEDELVLSTMLLAVHIARRPWQLRLTSADGAEVFAEYASREAPPAAAGGALALGWEERPGARPAMRETFHLAPDEGLFGLGDQPGPLNHRGQTIHCGAGRGRAAASQRPNKTVPFLWSTHGYGLFVHSYGDMDFDLGSRSPAACTVVVDDEQLDYFVIYGPAPADILRRYAEITGHAPVPPPWSLGFCISQPGACSQAAVEEACATIRARHIPCDAVHINDPWTADCAPAWNPKAYPEPEKLLADLGDIGFRVGLSISPAAGKGTAPFDEGLKRGFLVGPAPSQAPAVPRLVDLTLPAARDWWKEQIRPLAAMGVVGLLADPAQVPPGSVYHDGTPEHHMHSRYPLLCQQTIREVLAEECGDQGLVWAPAVWAGSQRLSVPWSGAPAHSPAYMMAQLRAGLGLGLSGMPFWAHEVGGCGDRDPALFVRWCQFGFLSPFVHLRDGSPDALAALGWQAEDILRQYARLRSRLVPYLYSSAVASAQSGLPLMRPLVLSYPDDRNTWSLDNEYLLGEHILVAPSWEAEGDQRIYLPQGAWADYWTSAIHHGPGWIRCHAPLERLPLLIKAGAIIPTQEILHFLGEREPERLTLDVYPQSSGRFVLYDEEGGAHELLLQAAGDRLQLQVPPLQVKVEVVLHGVPEPAEVTIEGHDVPCQWEEGRACIQLGQGARLVYQGRSPIAPSGA